MHSVCGGGEFSFGKCLCNAGVVVLVLVVDGYLVCLEECGAFGDWFLFGTGGGVAVVLFFCFGYGFFACWLAVQADDR